MKDRDSKYYKTIFKSKILSFEQKLNKASEYANTKVEENIAMNSLFNLIKDTGILPITR
jgi:hypothetical protein